MESLVCHALALVREGRGQDGKQEAQDERGDVETEHFVSYVC